MIAPFTDDDHRSHPPAPPPQSLCAAVTQSVFNDGPTVLVVGDVKQQFLGFMRFLRFGKQTLGYVVFGWSCLRVDGLRLRYMVFF